MGHHNPPPFEAQRPRWHSFVEPPSNPPPFGAQHPYCPFKAQRPRWHSFLPPINVEPPSNPPPFGAQHPYSHTASCLPLFGEEREGWHIIRCLALIPFVTTQIYRKQILSSLGFPFRARPQGFKMRLLGEGFNTLINGGLFSSPTKCGTSQSYSW